MDWIVDMARLYESLGAHGVLKIDQKVLDDMRVKIAHELNKLDEKSDIFLPSISDFHLYIRRCLV